MINNKGKTQGCGAAQFLERLWLRLRVLIMSTAAPAPDRLQ